MKRLFVIVIILLLFIYGVFLFNVNTKDEETVVLRDNYLYSVLNKVAIKGTKNINILYYDYKDDTIAEYYDDTKTIYVDSNIDEDIVYKVIAHEYLHYVWNSLSKYDLDYIDNTVSSINVNNPALTYRVSIYKDLGLLNNSELFSIYCTELDDSTIPSLYKICNKYIDRDLLELELLFNK